MIIRGISCLISKVKGQTENIRITSIVGRFLEHSRIYIFGTESRRKIYISSADFMTRNTIKRVEVAAPIYDIDIQKKIMSIFNTLLSDNVKARVQYSNGLYKKKISKGEKVNSQLEFINKAYENSVSCNTEQSSANENNIEYQPSISYAIIIPKIHMHIILICVWIFFIFIVQLLHHIDCTEHHFDILNKN